MPSPAAAVDQMPHPCVQEATRGIVYCLLRLRALPVALGVGLSVLHPTLIQGRAPSASAENAYTVHTTVGSNRGARRSNRGEAR